MTKPDIERLKHGVRLQAGHVEPSGSLKLGSQKDKVKPASVRRSWAAAVVAVVSIVVVAVLSRGDDAPDERGPASTAAARPAASVSITTSGAAVMPTTTPTSTAPPAPTWPTASDSYQPGIYAGAGALLWPLPDWLSCSDGWCIGGIEGGRIGLWEANGVGADYLGSFSGEGDPTTVLTNVGQEVGFGGDVVRRLLQV